MRKTIVGVFAHPDDESFGPSGTLYQLAQKNDVYILCATRGEAGQNHHEDKTTELSRLREQELRDSAKILGIKEVHFLDFIDGTLCNNLYHKLADKIQEYLDKLQPAEIITFEHRGISGHIDHVVVSFAATFAAKKIPSIKRVLYYCISKEQRDLSQDYFIYMPPGYPQEKVDWVNDISDVWEIKKQAMFAHKTQRKDAENILKRNQNLPKHEYFHILNLK